MNKLFDFAIIKDTIRRLKVLGITLAVILAIEAIAFPILIYLMNTNAVDGGNVGVRNYTLYDVHPFIFLIYFAFAPIFTLVVFNFLNHRNACDYFHAVPKKRSTIFVSMVTGIMFWIVLLTVGSTLISVITSLFMSSTYVVSCSSIFVVSIGVLVASFYLVATVSLAMSLTGNIFNNFVVSFMILLIPRIVLTVSTAIVLGNIPIVRGDLMSLPFIDSSYNIYFSTYTTIMGLSNGLFSLKSIIYTLVLGFIYLIIALFVFKKRKSESAGLAAPTPALQAAFRIIICLVICLAPIYLIANSIIFDRNYSEIIIFLIVILYVVAIVVYFVYDIIATKSAKNLAKSAKQLIIVAIANMLILLFMYIGYNSILNYHPTKDEINYINIDFCESSLNGNYMSNDNSYFLTGTKNYKITDDKIKEIISDALKEDCEYVKEYKYMDYDDHSLAVSINSGGLSKQRIITLDNEDLKTIIDRLSEDPDYVNSIKYIPEYDEIEDKSYIYIDSPSALTGKQTKELYNMIYDYYNSMSHKDLLKNAILANNESQTVYTTLFVNIYDDTGSYTASLPIKSDMPEIAEKYFTLLMESESEDIDKVIAELKNDVLSDDGCKDITLDIFGIMQYNVDQVSITMKKTFNDFNYNPLNISRDYSDEEMQSIISFLETAKDNKFNSDMQLINVSYTSFDNVKSESSETKFLILPITNEQYKTLIQMAHDRNLYDYDLNETSISYD
ncbi:MAG: ABC transporter permease [Parasporobacterium sp.]|nr:ABC transporter permease [Parasporobacterium sp.]